MSNESFNESVNVMRTIGHVLAELDKAANKFPTWPDDPLHAIAVLGEEFGELTKAVLQLTYEPHKVTHAEMHKEAVQTAAMAIRFLLSVECDLYRFTPTPQHRQPLDVTECPDSLEGLQP